MPNRATCSGVVWSDQECSGVGHKNGHTHNPRPCPDPEARSEELSGCSRNGCVSGPRMVAAKRPGRKSEYPPVIGLHRQLGVHLRCGCSAEVVQVTQAHQIGITIEGVVSWKQVVQLPAGLESFLTEPFGRGVEYPGRSRTHVSVLSPSCKPGWAPLEE